MLGILARFAEGARGTSAPDRPMGVGASHHGVLLSLFNDMPPPSAATSKVWRLGPARGRTRSTWTGVRPDTAARNHHQACGPVLASCRLMASVLSASFLCGIVRRHLHAYENKEPGSCHHYAIALVSDPSGRQRMSIRAADLIAQVVPALSSAAIYSAARPQAGRLTERQCPPGVWYEINIGVSAACAARALGFWSRVFAIVERLLDKYVPASLTSRSWRDPGAGTSPAIPPAM